jgi:hypothetical protein
MKLTLSNDGAETLVIRTGRCERVLESGESLSIERPTGLFVCEYVYDFETRNPGFRANGVDQQEDAPPSESRDET